MLFLSKYRRPFRVPGVVVCCSFPSTVDNTIAHIVPPDTVLPNKCACACVGRLFLIPGHMQSIRHYLHNIHYILCSRCNAATGTMARAWARTGGLSWPPGGSRRMRRPVNLKSLHNAPFFQNGAKSGFEMCFGLSTLGAGAKTRLESRIKKFTPHCICRPTRRQTLCPRPPKTLRSCGKAPKR